MICNWQYLESSLKSKKCPGKSTSQPEMGVKLRSDLEMGVIFLSYALKWIADVSLIWGLVDNTAISAAVHGLQKKGVHSGTIVALGVIEEFAPLWEYGSRKYTEGLPLIDIPFGFATAGSSAIFKGRYNYEAFVTIGDIQVAVFEVTTVHSDKCNSPLS